MIRMLICDDEPVISDGMHEIFSQDERLDVYKVYSSEDAIEMVNRIRIDIVLLDIQMPGMNGLDVLEYIKQTWKYCQVIMLTGHNNFEYIYKATTYSGVKYILKSEGYKKITEAVNEAIDSILHQINTEEILDEAKKQLISMNGILKKDFLLNTLKGVFEEPTVSEYGIKMNVSISQPTILMQCKTFDDKKLNLIQRNQYLHQIGQVIGMHIASICLYEMIVGDSGYIYFFMQMHSPGQKAEAMLRGSLEIAQEYCKNKIDASVSFVVDLKPTPWDEIWEKTNQLNTLMSIMADSGRDMYICEVGEDTPYKQNNEFWSYSYNIPQSKFNQLVDALNNGQQEEFFFVFNEISQSVTQIKSIHALAAQEKYFIVAACLMNCINKYSLGIKLAFCTSLYKLTQIEAHSNWVDAFDFLKELSIQIFKLRSEEALVNKNELVSFIKNHVVKNIKNPDKLTLMYISEMLHFNPSYLSKLFKQLSGSNLSKYIIICRMDLAKSLLLSPDAKIADISEQVGYTSPANFTRVFKKVIGQSPHEFRLMSAIDNNS